MVTPARIVFVNGHNHLTDSAGHDCRYRTADGHPLCPGYWYVVSWSDDIEEPLFNVQASYGGPHASEQAAQNELQRLAGLPFQAKGPSPRAEVSAASVENPGYFPDWHCGP